MTGWAIEGKETVEEEKLEERKRRGKKEEKGGDEILTNLADLKKNKTIQVYRSDMAKHGDGTRRNVTNQVLFRKHTTMNIFRISTWTEKCDFSSKKKSLQKTID